MFKALRWSMENTHVYSFCNNYFFFGWVPAILYEVIENLYCTTFLDK